MDGGLFHAPTQAVRFLDPWRNARCEGAKALVAKILGNIVGYETYHGVRKRKRKAEDQVRLEAAATAIACDLMYSVVANDSRPIVVSRSHQVLGAKHRYQSPALNRRLPYVLDVLGSSELGWLEEECGYKNPFDGPNQRTRIRPSQRLVQNVSDFQVGPQSFGRSQDQEAIVLKRGKAHFWDKKAYLPYEDTAETFSYRDEMRVINEWLTNADVALDVTALETDRFVDVQERALRRYFTNGSFESGGRLYGGFWQPLSSRERLEALRINGEVVAGLDYGQIAPRILYGIAKADAPEGDIYDIPDLTTVQGVSYRPGVKKVMNSLMFTNPSRMPKGTKDLLPPGSRIDEVVRLIKAAHCSIAPLLGTAIGHRVQFMESQLMVRVLLSLRAEGIVALPIHDGVVVPASTEGLALDLMESLSEQVVGVRVPVSIEGLCE